MNAKQAMSSENLGVRITENGALDQKIWALKALRGKTFLSGGSGVILKFFEWLEGFGAKDRGSCGVWEFSLGFMEFWSV
jgi:hypothetical protein